MRPAQFLFRFARISKEFLDFGWPEVSGINTHEFPTGIDISPDLMDPLA